MTSSDPRAMLNRRWLQFSLRTFLVLLTAFAVWLGLHVGAARKQQALVAKVKATGGGVRYDFEIDRADPRSIIPKAQSWVPAWLVSKLGEDFFHDVVVVDLSDSLEGSPAWSDSKVTDEALSCLKGFPKLRGLYLNGANVTDEGLQHVADLTELELLRIEYAPWLTDVGIGQFHRLTKLKTLSINRSRLRGGCFDVLGRLPHLGFLSVQFNEITDDSLKHVRGMHQLRGLALGWNEVSDTGLMHLASLSKLEHLDLQGSKVTTRGLEYLNNLQELKSLDLSGSAVEDTSPLKKHLPRCRIDGP